MKVRTHQQALDELRREGVAARLKELRGRIKQDAFADMLGISLSTWARYERGERLPDGNLLLRFQDDGISLDWLIKGVGQKRWRGLTEADAEALASPMVMIPLYNVKLSGGRGHINWEAEKIGERGFHREWLRSEGMKPENLGLAPLAGRSMEPAMIEDDLLLWDRGDTVIRSGKPYCIRVRDELMVKYLSQQPDGSILCSSENSTMFPPFFLHSVAAEDESEIIGRIRHGGRVYR